MLICLLIRSWCCLADVSLMFLLVSLISAGLRLLMDILPLLLFIMSSGPLFIMFSFPFCFGITWRNFTWFAFHLTLILCYCCKGCSCVCWSVLRAVTSFIVALNSFEGSYIHFPTQPSNLCGLCIVCCAYRTRSLGWTHFVLVFVLYFFLFGPFSFSFFLFILLHHWSITDPLRNQ